MIPKTKNVLILETPSNTSTVFIPLGTLKAEKGMSWSTWLTSDYNTINEPKFTIRDKNGELVALDSAIEAGKEYSFYDAEIPKEPDYT